MLPDDIAIATGCAGQVYCVCSVVDEDYNVQPRSVYYADVQAEDIIYFNGSTIEFSCNIFCEHKCESLIIYNNASILWPYGYDDVPFDYKVNVYKSKYSRNHTLKIIKANATSAGSYLCLAEVWNNTYIVNKEIYFHMAGNCTYICILE